MAEAKAIVTNRIAWRKVSAKDSDWEFDFPVISDGWVLCHQIRIIAEDGTTTKIWRPIPIVT